MALALGGHGDGGAEGDRVGAGMLVDDLGIAQLLFDLQDLPLDERLLVPGDLVVGIFAQVPQLLRRLDARDHRWALRMDQVMQLGLERSLS